jgi:hypothetical protein
MRRIHGVSYIQNYDCKLHGEKVMVVSCVELVVAYPFDMGQWGKSLQSLIFYYSFSFLITCKLFPLFLMPSCTWLNHHVPGLHIKFELFCYSGYH